MNELNEILMQDKVDEYIKNNEDVYNRLMELIPELKDMVGFDHKHPCHHLDVWEHTLCALSYSEKDLDVRLVLLLHDIGKPHSFTEGEVRHFRDHPKKSAAMANDILRRLGYEEEYVEKLVFLIYNHDNRMSIDFTIFNKELALKLYSIQRCDSMAHAPVIVEGRLKKLNENYRYIL